MKKMIAALVVGATLAASPAHAYDIGVTNTAFDLMNRCEETQNGRDLPLELLEKSYGIGFCLGVVSDFTYLARVKVLSKICLPDTVSSGQAVNIFLAYAKKHPEQQHLSYQIVMSKSLAEVFPCPATAAAIH